MTDPLITIVDVPSIGKYAVRRPALQGELTPKWFSGVGAVTVSQYRITFEVPETKLLFSSFAREPHIDVTLFFPEPIKGSVNKEARVLKALTAEGLAYGTPVVSQKILDAFDKKLAHYVDSFNETFKAKVMDMAAKADSIWDQKAFATERAVIKALAEVRRTLSGHLKVAKDDLHAKGRAQLIEYLQEKQLPEGLLDYDKLSKVERQFDPFFGGE